ncbi:helix-turn-helix domain-containing protein [Streptomyces sp. NPDC051014]|uniref:winged helix-turn-helix transcriptional regulator n=1 Tax=Streptomyces sp. NPDC051014 TaxID=3155751 RepID=UPI0033EA5A13
MDVQPQQAGESGAESAGTAVKPLPSVMAGAPVGVRPCSIAAALQVVGERWSLLAVREMAYGVHRFAKIAGFTGAPRDILADRLRKLEATGVIERRPYSEHPPRHEYHLTQAGRELFPVLVGLLQWGDRWAVDTPAVAFRHECGHPLRMESGCGHCEGEITPQSLSLMPGFPRP